MKVKGLQKEIVLWTAVPIIAIFVIAVLILRMNLTGQVSQVIDEELRLQAAQVTTATEEFFDEHVAYCQAMGSTEAVKNMIYEGLERDVNYIDTSYYWPARNSMAALAEKFPAIMQAYVGGTLRNDMMTHDGVSILDLPEGFDILSRDWAIASVNGEICYMPPYVDAVTGNMVTTVSAPIMDDGRVIGSFGLDLLLTDVQDIFATTEVGQTGFVVVFLPDGTVFYHPNEEYNTLPYTEIGLSDEALEVMDNNITNTVVKFKMDGEKYVGTLNNIGETGWSMLTCMTQKEAYSVSNSGVLMMVIILLVALLLIISIISYVGHLIVRPIVRLVYSAKKLAVGDVEIECEHRDVEHDEVDELINAFAEVVENNKRQADELESLANGNTELVVDVRSSSDVLNIAMKKVVDTLNDLIAETADLTQNMILGNTTHRGNAARFEGGYKNIIEGFNQTIDAIMAEIDIFAGALSELGQGEMPEITASVEGDYVKIVDSLKASVANIRGMVDDTQTMMAATANGNFGERVDARRYKGEFLKIIEGINKTLDTVVDKTAWYEAIINSIPLPVQVMDSSENWALVNTAFYETMRKADSSIVHITDIYGRKCYMEGLEINGVPALKEGNPDTRLDFQGKNYMQTTAPLKDKFGKSIGYVGTWQDLTSVLKSSEFAANEIGRLQGNLHNLALGNFEFAKSTQSVDEYTKDLADQFMVIDASMNEVADAVGKLIEDTKEMVEAAVDGDLGKRLDASVHSGEYAAVVQGINNILDEVLAPIGETLTVLQEVAAGNLQKMVEGDYRGEHAQTKDALNNTILNLRRVIDEIAEVLAAIGGGDLTVSINADNYAGDFVAIKDAMLNITARLRGVMKGLNESSEQVANGSRQLSEAAQTLANGSTQQASAIEQLTATVTEIAGQTKHNADDAREASSLANGVKSSAERGDRQMKEMLVSMDEINESSANISKIIKTIDDIAFQTNILALNAAVEAARAGVHGKGFAVVADEVRSLAAKSAQAAAETTALIEGSIDKVEAGTKIANETAEALGEIVEGIGKTADIVDRIAAASGEQAVGINEVNKGIEQVSEVVQSNSATAEESAASSQELYNQADMLKKMVSSFRIKGKGHRNRGSNVPAMRIEPEVEPSFTENSTPEINISLDFDVNDKY